MANIGGRTFVNIDGEHASGDITITELYGGNDIAGTIGTYGKPDKRDSIPTELTNVVPEPTDLGGKTLATYMKTYQKTHPLTNAVDNTWNTFVRTSRSTKEEGGKTIDNQHVVVGSLFGGGLLGSLLGLFKK